MKIFINAKKNICADKVLGIQDSYYSIIFTVIPGASFSTLKVNIFLSLFETKNGLKSGKSFYFLATL